MRATAAGRAAPHLTTEAVLTGVVAVMAGWVEVGWEGAGKAVVAREAAGKAVVARVVAEKVEREVEGWEEACTTCNQPARHDSKLAALRSKPQPTITCLAELQDAAQRQKAQRQPRLTHRKTIEHRQLTSSSQAF